MISRMIQDSSTTVTKGENLLKDGDFENGDHTVYNVGNFGAWYDAGNDSGDIIKGTQAYHNGNAADNEIWELDKGSVLCQIFEAPAAGKYCLTFDVYDNNCLGYYDDSFKVKINGQTVETVRVTADGTITIELDLAAGQNRLDFVSLSQVSGKGPGIDNIELRQEITDLFRRAAGPHALPFLPEQLAGDFDGETVGPEFAGSVASRYFNFRKLSIFGGSNEIQKNIIAKNILGLPETTQKG